MLGRTCESCSKNTLHVANLHTSEMQELHAAFRNPQRSLLGAADALNGYDLRSASGSPLRISKRVQTTIGKKNSCGGLDDFVRWGMRKFRPTVTLPNLNIKKTKPR